MPMNNPRVLRAMLDTMYLVGLHRLLSGTFSGVGLILTLHHVRPEGDRNAFCPNRILDITPEFLEQTILQIAKLGYDFVSLDEVHRRLTTQDFRRKFVCFTLDDGYLDNLEHAAPVFEKHNVPFTIYVATGMPDSGMRQWWQHLEDVVADNEFIDIRVGDKAFSLPTRNTAEKYAAFEQVYWCLRAAPHAVQQEAIDRMLGDFGIDSSLLTAESAMTWDQLRTVAASANAAIGAHTVNHFALSKLSEDEIRWEVDQSRQRLAAELAIEPMHFSYPYGAPDSAAAREFAVVGDMGFLTATTTRKGVLFPEHADHLHALPRVSLNGDYQNRRYIAMFLSGLPFALANKLKRLDVN